MERGGCLGGRSKALIGTGGEDGERGDGETERRRGGKKTRMPLKLELSGQASGGGEVDCWHFQLAEEPDDRDRGPRREGRGQRGLVWMKEQPSKTGGEDQAVPANTYNTTRHHGGAGIPKPAYSTVCVNNYNIGTIGPNGASGSGVAKRSLSDPSPGTQLDLACGINGRCTSIAGKHAQWRRQSRSPGECRGIQEWTGCIMQHGSCTTVDMGVIRLRRGSGSLQAKKSQLRGHSHNTIQKASN